VISKMRHGAVRSSASPSAPASPGRSWSGCLPAWRGFRVEGGLVVVDHKLLVAVRGGLALVSRVFHPGQLREHPLNEAGGVVNITALFFGHYTSSNAQIRPNPSQTAGSEPRWGRYPHGGEWLVYTK
jgi:hypothetical protein